MNTINKTLEELYEEKCSIRSDIYQHLPLLYELAKECHGGIAEFGVRRVVSTYALANARPQKLICVDLVESPEVKGFLEMSKSENINCRFYKADTRLFDLEDVDFLFIDTLHRYSQLKEELIRHHRRVHKYIAMHGTVTFGDRDEGTRNQGPGYASE